MFISTMKPLLFTTALCLLPMFHLFSEPLKVGAEAPSATVTIHSGESLDLAGVYGEGIVLVYFYPKADTPGCTAQACSLRDAYTEISDQNVRVLGVSGDKPEKLQAFREKFNLPFDLVSDSGGELMKAFGVPHALGIAARQAFLVSDGKIIWRDTSASTSKQAEDVLAALSTQNSTE